MSQEPTNAEILKVITEGQKRTDGRIDKIDERFDKVDKHIADVLEVVNDFSTKVDKRFDKVETDVGTLKSDVAYLKSNMVTKDDLERSQAKQKGEIIMTMRKGDIKLRELITIMHGKQMLTDTEVQHLITMEPFAQLSV